MDTEKVDLSALYRIGYGLYVITTNDGKKDNGCIVNSVMQVTGSPLRVAVCVNKQNYSCETILKTLEMNLNCLAEDTPFEIFKRFGFQSGRDTDKFRDYPNSERAENGIYYIPGYTNAYFCCKVKSVTDLGTHLLFIAEVEDAEILSDFESMTYDFYHKNVKPKPQKTEKKGYRCKICGYIYEGETLPEDFVCPVCKHPASDFERIE